MDDLARYAKKMGGWENLARALYTKLVPFIEAEHRLRRCEHGLALGKLFSADEKKRGRSLEHNFVWLADVLSKLEQSRRAKPYESTEYHLKHLVMRLYPGLRPRAQGAKIKTLRNIVSEHKNQQKRVSQLLLEGNITSDSGDVSVNDTDS
jgi:hypothetical protein